MHGLLQKSKLHDVDFRVVPLPLLYSLLLLTGGMLNKFLLYNLKKKKIAHFTNSSSSYKKFRLKKEVNFWNLISFAL